MTGQIIQLMREKNYGFIRGADKREYFFHASALKNAKFQDLEKGLEVEFEDAESDKGLRAEDIFLTR